MSTTESALFVPLTRLVKQPYALEQPVRGRIQMRRQIRNLPTQILDGNHGEKCTTVGCK